MKSCLVRKNSIETILSKNDARSRIRVFGSRRVGSAEDQPPDMVVASQMVSHFELINPRCPRTMLRFTRLGERERERERGRSAGACTACEVTQRGQSANINLPLIYYNLGLLLPVRTLERAGNPGTRSRLHNRHESAYSLNYFYLC